MHDKSVRKTVYRVSGFSCANCANTFENNVRNLPGVIDAKVNFGASKITVYGEASVKELEKAGAFERLKVTPEDEPFAAEKKKPFFIEHWNVIVAFLFVVLGFLFREGNISSTLSFAIAIVIGGYDLFKTGLNHLVRFKFDMNTLMTIAIIGAALIGEWAEGAIVVILFAISEMLERFSMDKARDSLRSLLSLSPNVATVIRNGEERIVDVNDIVIGDTMIVKPGERIAIDGIVRAGHSAVNEAAITGESLPVEKNIGDAVFAGTLNGEGLLRVEVTKLVQDTALAKIIHLVKEAQGKRAPSQRFVDVFAKYYTPLILVVATLVAIVPPLFFNASWETWVYQGLAVLVVGCPCALVISTPVAIVTAIGHAAKHGVLFKGGIYLEAIGKLKAIAFDKTGTLTKGTPVVTDFIVYDETRDEKELFTYVAALEHRSRHPLADAIVNKAKEDGLAFSTVSIERFLQIAGKGIQGTIDGTNYFIGKPSFFATLDEKMKRDVERLERQGKTVMLVGQEKTVLALLACADEVREVSKTVVQSLKRLGVEKTVMLTGDNEKTAHAVAEKLGVTDVYADLLPEQKLTILQRLQREFRHVAMVGDGVNDAPALAAATVGIAMGKTGTDTALETADVALMSDDLNKLPFVVRLSRKTLAVIKQNIAFALGIKLVALLFVVPNWLTLWLAIVADMGATLLVTLNGLRLLRVKAGD